MLLQGAQGLRCGVPIRVVLPYATHKIASDVTHEYRFTSCQNEYLNLMMQPDNQNLWAQLLGGLVTGGGQIITPNTDWVPTGALA